VGGPAALLDPRVRQPDGRAVYDLVTGHPARTPRELVFLADLAVEPREWQDTDWAALGVDVDGVAEAVVLLARRGQVRARWCHELSAEAVKALGRPVMEYAASSCAAGWLAGRTSSTCAGCTRPADAVRASRFCSPACLGVRLGHPRTPRTRRAVQRGHLSGR
jgi:hypothetical protein